MMSEMSERHACHKQHDENYSKDREVKGKKDKKRHTMTQYRTKQATGQHCPI